jgi:Ca2+-binding EF-hand superfamily protein
MLDLRSGPQAVARLVPGVAGAVACVLHPSLSQSTHRFKEEYSMKIQKLAFATMLALGVSTVAFAQSQQRAPRGGDRTEQVSFERADKNADGRVSREEANDIDGFDFSRADTNNDASLTRQEFQAAMATSTPRSDRGAGDGRTGSNARGGQSGALGGSASTHDANAGNQSRGGGSQSGSRDRDDNGSGAGSRSASMSFDAVDKNNNGKVSRDEASEVRGLNFSAADVDGDSSLSRQEFQVAIAGSQPRG